MSSGFPMGKLATALKQRSEFIEIDDFATYKRCRVQLHTQGIVERDEVPGAEIKTKKQQVCHATEFLVAEIDAKVGGFGIVPENLEGAIVSSHYFLFTIDETVLDRRFLDYCTRTHAFMDQVRAQGTTNYAAIRPSNVLNYEIPLPPLAEQRRIVARIEELAAKIEEARGLRREAEEEANAFVPSFLSNAFDYDIDDTLPNKWKWVSLEEILVDEKGGITTGPFGTLLQKSDIHLEGIPVLGIANIQPNRFIPHFTDYVDFEKAEELSSYKLVAEDIVIARSGTVGRCCVLPGDITPNPIMSTNLIRLRLNKEAFVPELLCRLFNGSSLIERYKKEECYGSTRTFFTQKMLLKLTLPAPPLTEQRRIIAHLDALQAQIDALKRRQAEAAAELDALLPSILDKAFKGEL